MGGLRGEVHCRRTHGRSVSRLRGAARVGCPGRGKACSRRGQRGRHGASDPGGRASGVFRCDGTGIPGYGGRSPGRTLRPAADAEAARVAVTLTEAQLAEAVAVTRAQAARLLPVATAMVERYAQRAPDVMHNESAIRVCGYLSQQPESSQRSDRIGDVETQWAPGNVSALRHSGAMALLTLWKVRRAGVVSA